MEGIAEKWVTTADWKLLEIEKSHMISWLDDKRLWVIEMLTSGRTHIYSVKGEYSNNIRSKRNIYENTWHLSLLLVRTYSSIASPARSLKQRKSICQSPRFQPKDMRLKHQSERCIYFLFLLLRTPQRLQNSSNFCCEYFCCMNFGWDAVEHK